MAKITSRRSALPLRKNASTKSFINAFVSFIIPFILGMIVSQMLVIPDFDQTKSVAVEDDDYDDDKEVGDDGDINGDGMELEKNFDSNSNSKRKDFVYVPASTEEYIMNHFEELGFNIENYKEAKGCPIWLEPEVSTQENYDNLRAYLNELAIFSAKMEEFDKPVPNLVETIRRMNGNGSSGITDQVELCKIVRPHPDGIQALFPSKQLSLTPAGYAEPLLTPMRHPEYCSEGINLHNLLRLDFLIHDFEQMCLNLKPHSKTILVDIGASLEFNHGGRSRKSEPPIVTFLKTFEKFGFHFDHIYAAEITPFDPKNVFAELLPEKYFTSYHWMNTGVTAEKDNKLNLLQSIVSKFDEDDLVIVKLDIDTADIEVPLTKQLLEDDSINKLVDHFYFEHHVHIGEMGMSWHGHMKGTMQDSFELINGLRKKGVASHFWV